MEAENDAPVEIKMSDTKKMMETEVVKEYIWINKRNEVKRKGKASRKRKNLMSQLNKQIPSKIIQKYADEEVQM